MPSDRKPSAGSGLSTDEVRRWLKELGRPATARELAQRSGLHPGQQRALKRELKALARAGVLEREGKRFALSASGAEARTAPRAARGAPPRRTGAATSGGQGKGRTGGRRPPAATPQRGSARVDRQGPRVQGTLSLHRDGFGFVRPSDGSEESIYLPPEEAARALDKDQLEVELVPGRDGRTAGRVVRLLRRAREQVVGTYLERARDAVVQPHDPSLGPVRVPRTQIARDGDVVKVRLGVGQGLLGSGEGLIGEVSGSLGKPGDPSAEVLSIAFSHGFSDEFPPEVMDEADAIPLVVPVDEALAEGRRDLRDLPLVTIDGEDARDFDDAIYVERQGRDWRLVVAIADVSHYVIEGSALDAEAYKRATSVYLPNRVLPMLPERLSNGLCSLRPEEDRLCMVADMRLDAAGQPLDAELYPAVMRSAARCTYNEVQSVLDGVEVPHRMKFRPLFELARELARTLTQMRRGRGAIDFDLPETRVELDEDGKPARLVRRDRLEAHRLIEECMLAANEAVARFFHERKLPTVNRYHGEPDRQKLEAFAALARAHGFFLAGEDPTSADLNRLLEQLKGHAEQKALNQLLLRSMMQAVYSSEERGHYGLAADHYLHFTSPIRRYPDLLVHRLLKAHWATRAKGRRGTGAPKRKVGPAQLEDMASHSSDQERAAMLVEREVNAFYATLMMKDRVGEEFPATVSSLTDFGFFVELEALYIEGLVKGETLGPRFRLDARTHALVYATGRRVRVGDKLRVRLKSANVVRRHLDFEVVEEGAVGEDAPPRRHEPARRAPGRNTREEAPRGESPHPGFDRMRALAQQKGKRGGGSGSDRGSSSRSARGGRRFKPGGKRR